MIRILLIFLTLNLSAFASYSGGKWTKSRFNQATGLVPQSFNFDKSDRVTDVHIDCKVQQSFTFANGQLTREETCTADWADNKTFECHQRGRLKTTKGALAWLPSFFHFLDENETKTLMTARDRRLFEFESESVAGNGDLVKAHHSSQVIAIGMRDGPGDTQWTHVFGRGPLGVAFIKDLTHTGHDASIFTDHLGTPFVYKKPQTNVVTYTSYNPWGELLASHPYPQPQYANQGAVPTWGFQLPTDPVFSFPTLGLSGHVYDHHTGLVYMHHRYYHPRLGHFLTPDFRAPDIYDPSTFTELYAFATGNPVMFWDPDGLAVEYVGNGRVKIEARDIHGILQTPYMPQGHWIKLVTGQAVGYGHYTGEYFKLKSGVPDLTTDQGQGLYKVRANAVLEHFFGPGTEITKGIDENTKDVSTVVVNRSLIFFGLGAGAQSGFTFVRGLTYTAEAGLSGYAVYDGVGNIYEGIQDGSGKQIAWGTFETATGALGGYGSVRALAGEIRAGLGSSALVVDEALLNAYVAENLGPVAQRIRLVVQNNAPRTPTSTTALTKYWPENNGFVGEIVETFLYKGQKIDRYGGGDWSRFFSPQGTPDFARALPPGTSGQLRTFEVMKPFPVQSGHVAPAFGQIGGGRQMVSPVKLKTLLEKGILREVTP